MPSRSFAASRPSLVILNGPTAAGKSTAASLLLETYGSGGEIAVLERDMFEDLNGRLQAVPGGETQKRIWKAALPVMIDAARAYLRQGISVVVVAPFYERDYPRFDRAFGKWEPKYACILPSWSANRSRRNKRMRVTNRDELDMFDWESHASFYDELTAMAEHGLFDEVIDSTEMKPVQVADALAKLMDLSRA